MKKLLDNYGIFWVLIGLCAFFSILTLKKQTPSGPAAVEEVFQTLENNYDIDALIAVVGAQNQGSAGFAESLSSRLAEAGFSNVRTSIGHPSDFRKLLEEQAAQGQVFQVVATTEDLLKWTVIHSLSEDFDESGKTHVITPESYWWPDFLKRANLLAVVDRIVVIAVIAIGMTMV
ncbi:MAG: hypothetical protein KJT03_19575, partial [Verrucomicrobiae bacterium]|nr:hypothetical protein [Verrucomicrobiae bacterium]